VVDCVALLGVARAGGEQGDLAGLPALVQQGLDGVVGGGDRVRLRDVDDADR